MVTSSFHTSYVLQPLDGNCFKPFKTTFKKYKDNAMVRNTFTGSVNKAKDQFLSKKKSIMGLRLLECNHSIPKVWMKKPNQTRYI
jgi:hypothetical protein